MVGGPVRSSVKVKKEEQEEEEKEGRNHLAGEDGMGEEPPLTCAMPCNRVANFMSHDHRELLLTFQHLE